MTVIITELRNDLEPDRDPSFNPNVFSEDEEEAAQAAATPITATSSSSAAVASSSSSSAVAATNGVTVSSKSAFQSVGRGGAVVPPEPPSGVNVAFCSVVTSPVGAGGKRSPPPAELSLAAASSRGHVIVAGCNGSQSPSDDVTADSNSMLNCRPSPISSSNTIIDLNATNEATPTGGVSSPSAVAIAPALPGVSARRLKTASEVNGLPPAHNGPSSTNNTHLPNTSMGITSSGWC